MTTETFLKKNNDICKDKVLVFSLSDQSNFFLFLDSQRSLKNLKERFFDSYYGFYNVFSFFK